MFHSRLRAAFLFSTLVPPEGGFTPLCLWSEGSSPQAAHHLPPCRRVYLTVLEVGRVRLSDPSYGCYSWDVQRGRCRCCGAQATDRFGHALDCLVEDRCVEDEDF